MYKLLAGFGLLFAVATQAQAIKRDEVDGFTRQRSLETTVVSLKAAYTKGMGLSIGTQGNHLIINLVGYGDGIGPIRKQDVLYFLFEDGLIVTATSIGEQPENEGGTSRLFQHHYLIRRKDLVDLANKKVALVRVSTMKGNLDIPTGKRTSKEIQALGSLVVKTLDQTRN